VRQFWASLPVAGVGLETLSGSKATIYSVVKEPFYMISGDLSQSHSHVALAHLDRNVSCELAVKRLCLYMRGDLSSTCSVFRVHQCLCRLCWGLLHSGCPAWHSNGRRCSAVSLQCCELNALCCGCILHVTRWCLVMPIYAIVI